jgi:hypothetical protein
MKPAVAIADHMPLPCIHAGDADRSGNHSKITFSHLNPLLRIAIGFEAHNPRLQRQCLLFRVNPVQLARLNAPLPMLQPSAIAFARWASPKSSLPRDHPGRIPTLSVSSGRSAENAWITSSSSTSVTCAECCRAIFNIIMTRERIFRSTRTVHGLIRYSYPQEAITLLPSRRLAACIIAMNVKPRKNGEAAHCLSLPSIAQN